MVKTQAYVLLPPATRSSKNAFDLRDIELPDLQADQVLVRPLIGCWEGNMTHALHRSPLDLCVTRNEEFVVVGNAGVVEIVDMGHAVDGLSKGQKCMVFCNGVPDAHGYPEKIYGYDQRGSIGLLAKETVLRQNQLLPIPADSRGTLAQWACFSLRYITAWANWRLAYGCWNLQVAQGSDVPCRVLAWGGGVSFAEVTLAKLLNGCDVAMISSGLSRLSLLAEHGVTPIKRGADNSPDTVQAILDEVMEWSKGQGASILVDNIGAHYRSSLKMLSREGVLATSGWKLAATFPTVRSAECIERHIHVFTHYARLQEGKDAMSFAEAHGWLPPAEVPQYHWEDIPELGAAHAAGEIDDLFPLFSISE